MCCCAVFADDIANVAVLCMQACMQVHARAAVSRSQCHAAPMSVFMLIMLKSACYIPMVAAQVLVTDTAGVRAAGGEVEAEGVRRALAAASAADIVAIVADATAHPGIAAAAAVTAQHGRNGLPGDGLGGQLDCRPDAAAREARSGDDDKGRVQRGRGDEAGAAGRVQSTEARTRAACRGLFADFASAAASTASDSTAAGEPWPPAGQPAAQAPPPCRVEHGVAPTMPVASGSVLEVLLGPDELGPSISAGELDGAIAGVGTREGCAAAPAQQVLLVANKWDLLGPGGALRDAETPFPSNVALGSAPAGKEGRAESEGLGPGFPKPRPDQARWRACAVSCRTGEGMDALLAELRSAVAAVVGGGGAVDDAALVTRCALVVSDHARHGHCKLDGACAA